MTPDLFVAPVIGHVVVFKRFIVWFPALPVEIQAVHLIEWSVS
jgi:hypothetical protein